MRGLLFSTRLRRFVLVTAWLLCSPVAVAELLRPVSTAAEHAAVESAVGARLERIVALIEESNAPNLMGHERWGELLELHRPIIERARSHSAFADAVNAMIEGTGLSHFHYYTSDDWSFWHLRSAYGHGDPDTEVAHIGVYPERIGDSWFVRGILEDSVAAEANLRVGDELLSVDGLPFEPIGSFRGKEGTPVSLHVRRKPGLIYEIAIVPVKESLYDAVQRAVMKSIRTVEYGGYTYAYLHGWSLLGSAEEYWELLDMQDEVDGLVLDYRDGIGGYLGRGRGFLFGPLGEHRHWTKPTVILIADGTRSAKEPLVREAQERKRAPLVGTPTPGHVTTVGAVRKVGDDGLLMLPGNRHALEGRPTKPDYPVERDIRFCAGADPQLKRAKEILAELVRGADNSDSLDTAATLQR